MANRIQIQGLLKQELKVLVCPGAANGRTWKRCGVCQATGWRSISRGEWCFQSVGYTKELALHPLKSFENLQYFFSSFFQTNICFEIICLDIYWVDYKLFGSFKKMNIFFKTLFLKSFHNESTPFWDIWFPS